MPRPYLSSLWRPVWHSKLAEAGGAEGRGAEGRGAEGRGAAAGTAARHPRVAVPPPSVAGVGAGRTGHGTGARAPRTAGRPCDGHATHAEHACRTAGYTTRAGRACGQARAASVARSRRARGVWHAWAHATRGAGRQERRRARTRGPGARKCTACTRVCCVCTCGIGYVSTRTRACCVLCLSAQGAWGRPRVAACACRSPLEVREAGRLGKDTFPQGTVDLPGAAVPRQVCQQQGIHPHTETLLSSTGTRAHAGARDGRALGLRPSTLGSSPSCGLRMAGVPSGHPRTPRVLRGHRDSAPQPTRQRLQTKPPGSPRALTQALLAVLPRQRGDRGSGAGSPVASGAAPAAGAPSPTAVSRPTHRALRFRFLV